MAEVADLIVAGAGPAGAAAACYFARLGFRVVLLDRCAFPRDKVCGDFVGPLALDELEALGIASHAAFGTTHRVRRAALHLDGRGIVERPLPCAGLAHDYGLCIPRKTLDSEIVREAVASGARLLEEACVTGYETGKSAATVVYRRARRMETVRARLVLGADGSASTVARILRGEPPPRRDRIIAARAYFDGVRGDAARADLYVTSPIFPGYCWLFPNGSSTANVGIGMLLEAFPPADQHLRDALFHLIRTDAALGSRLGGATMLDKVAGWPLATFDPHLPVVADRVALLGDAAGFINPINGEGIQYALQSARWCAETLRDALANDRVAAAGLAPYARRVRAEMHADMAVSRLLIEFARNRRLNRFWLSVVAAAARQASADAEYANVVGGVLAGTSRTRNVFSMPFFATTMREIARTCDPLGALGTLAARPVSTVCWSAGCVRAMAEVASAAWREARLPLRAN